MNYEQAYQWLHGDRIEYSGCRASAEAMDSQVKALLSALEAIHQSSGQSWVRRTAREAIEAHKAATGRAVEA
jgi:hypothetical protein